MYYMHAIDWKGKKTKAMLSMLVRLLVLASGTANLSVFAHLFSVFVSSLPFYYNSTVPTMKSKS